MASCAIFPKSPAQDQPSIARILILMIMDENIIQEKLEKLLPFYYEVQVWHPSQFITVEIISKRCIHLQPDVMDFLSSLHIQVIHFGFHHAGSVHHVTFKLLG